MLTKLYLLLLSFVIAAPTYAVGTGSRVADNDTEIEFHS